MTETGDAAPALDFTAFDYGVRVQDDLFRHVNGTWLETAEIPPDKPLAGAFMNLRDRAEEAVRDIITTLEQGGTTPLEPSALRDAPPERLDETKIADLYASFMDAEAVEALGASPLSPLFAAIDAVTSMPELARLLGRFARSGVGGLVGVDTESDPGDPNRYVMFAGQGGIGLPDEAYYRLDEHAAIREAYQTHLRTSLELAGVEHPATQAQRIFDLETKIAGTHWDKVRCRDLRQMYNLMGLDDFVTAAPELHWREFLDGAGIDESAMSELVAAQPSFFAEVSTLLTEDRLSAWLAWAKWRVINSLAPYLSSAFVEENFRFYGTVLSGTPELRERWKRGVSLVEGSLGEAVGRVYVQRHFSSVAKERMDILVANLIEAYRRSIIDLDWMTEETKEQALDKLGKFRPHIGYPTKWRDYSKLEISRDDLVGNVMRVASFELDRSIAKIGQPIDREEWLMTPQTVNAYYHPLKNEIVFPAAILQPPFFNEHADDAVNYGGIGAVIGHEIGHGFDDQGSTCDGDGALRDWWTEKDREAFEQRTTALVEQFDALEPRQTPGHRVNGKLTIGENIGDLGGLSIAFKAYLLSRNTGPGPVEGRADEIDGYTPEQRLFLSWGAVWQAKIRTEMVLQRMATDPHSPAEFRCNQIVRNLPEFYAAFGVTETDALWLDEDRRVKIVIADGEPTSIDELAAQIKARAGGSLPMIIAVDGHSSSGKSTLAGRLAAALPGSAVLHTDDLAWHQGVFAWDVLLLEDVLPVVRSGVPLEYRPPQWVARSRAGSITLPGDLEFLLVEGVGASQPSLRSAYAMIIWVETDEPTRLARDQVRVAAGETTPDDYTSWMAEENAYTTRERPWDHADLLISGAKSPSPPSESNAAFDSRAALRLLPERSAKMRRPV